MTFAYPTLLSSSSWSLTLAACLPAPTGPLTADQPPVETRSDAEPTGTWSPP